MIETKVQSGVQREERMVRSEVFWRRWETMRQGSVGVEDEGAVESVISRGFRAGRRAVR